MGGGFQRFHTFPNRYSIKWNIWFEIQITPGWIIMVQTPHQGSPEVRGEEVVELWDGCCRNVGGWFDMVFFVVAGSLGRVEVGGRGKDSLCVRSTAFRLVPAWGLITTTICPCSTAELGKQEPCDGFLIEPSSYPTTGIRICILPVTFLPCSSFALYVCFCIDKYCGFLDWRSWI